MAVSLCSPCSAGPPLCRKQLLLLGTLAACVSCGAGCATLSSWWGRRPDTPPTGEISRLTAIWEPQVRFASDPLHQGNRVPCLAGRLYLFGADDPFPRAGEGKLLVCLYRDDLRGPDGQPFLASYWEMDCDKLRPFLHKDLIGWGYDLCLPLDKCEPQPLHVHLTVQYQGKKGPPLLISSGPLILQPPESIQVVPQHQLIQPSASGSATGSGAAASPGATGAVAGSSFLTPAVPAMPPARPLRSDTEVVTGPGTGAAAPSASWPAGTPAAVAAPALAPTTPAASSANPATSTPATAETSVWTYRRAD